MHRILLHWEEYRQQRESNTCLIVAILLGDFSKIIDAVDVPSKSLVEQTVDVSMVLADRTWSRFESKGDIESGVPRCFY